MSAPERANLTRVNLQVLAEAKFRDAALLLENGRFGNAYYLAGYAVELGLKACASRQFRQDEIPDKRLVRPTNGIFTHDFVNLVGLSGIKTELAREQDANERFQAYWAIVAEWSPESRYDIIEKISAQLLLQAVGDPDDGVLRWIKQHW